MALSAVLAWSRRDCTYHCEGRDNGQHSRAGMMVGGWTVVLAALLALNGASALSGGPYYGDVSPALRFIRVDNLTPSYAERAAKLHTRMGQCNLAWPHRALTMARAATGTAGAKV